MSGIENKLRKILWNDVLNHDPAAKYDVFPEPGGAIDVEKLSNESTMGTYHYVSDSNGNIKWLFPVKSRFPLFLTFYKSTSYQARFYRWFVHWAFKLNLKKLVISGSIQLDEEKFKYLRDLLSKIKYDDFAVSLERMNQKGKSLFALGLKGAVTHLVKVAHSADAEDELENEMYALEILDQGRFKYFCHSSIANFLSPGVLVLNNVGALSEGPTGTLSKEHLTTLVELNDRYRHEFSLGELSVYQDIKDDLSIIQEKLKKEDRSIEQIVKNIQHEFEKLPANISIPVSFAHNNFTPLNTYKHLCKLYISDWETAQESMPLLHDLFHFIYQSGLLFKKNSTYIHQQIEKAIEDAPMKEFIQKNGINISFHHKVYMLSAITSEIKKYVLNPSKSLQARKRLNYFEDAFIAIT